MQSDFIQRFLFKETDFDSRKASSKKERKKHVWMVSLSHLRFYANYHVSLALPGLRMWVSRVVFGLCRLCHTSPAPTQFRGAWDRTSGSSTTAWRCLWWSTKRLWTFLSIASALGLPFDKAERRLSTGLCNDAQPVGILSHSPRSIDKCSTWILSWNSDCQRCLSTLKWFNSTSKLLHLIA